jgi:hypothetical protein
MSLAEPSSGAPFSHWSCQVVVLVKDRLDGGVHAVGYTCSVSQRKAFFWVVRGINLRRSPAGVVVWSFCCCSCDYASRLLDVIFSAAVFSERLIAEYTTKKVRHVGGVGLWRWRRERISFVLFQSSAVHLTFIREMVMVGGGAVAGQGPGPEAISLAIGQTRWASHI